jgi:hypothetical protein
VPLARLANRNDKEHCPRDSESDIPLARMVKKRKTKRNENKKKNDNKRK